MVICISIMRCIQDITNLPICILLLFPQYKWFAFIKCLLNTSHCTFYHTSQVKIFSLEKVNFINDHTGCCNLIVSLFFCKPIKNTSYDSKGRDNVNAQMVVLMNAKV